MILRVPLVIPNIKVLKILSGKLLFRRVSGIINKIEEMREAARTTLCSVMELLGPRVPGTYIGFVIKEMSANLTRG